MDNFNDFIKKKPEIISEEKIMSKTDEFNFNDEADIVKFTEKVISQALPLDETDYELLRLLLLSIICCTIAFSKENSVANFNACLETIDENLKYEKSAPAECFYAFKVKSLPKTHPARESYEILEDLPKEQIYSYFKKLKKIIENFTV